MGRAPCCSKVGLHRGPWTVREDALLTNYIQNHGEGNWRSLPKKAGLLRCGKSCRLRWMNYLRPDIKRGNIGPEEEDLIIRLHSLLGNRWSLIAGRLPGRTDNEIKNYWNSHLSKKLKRQGIELREGTTKPCTTKRSSKSSSQTATEKEDKRSKNKKKLPIIQEEERENTPKTKIHAPKPTRLTLAMRNSSNASTKTSQGSGINVESNSPTEDERGDITSWPEVDNINEGSLFIDSDHMHGFKSYYGMDCDFQYELLDRVYQEYSQLLTTDQKDQFPLFSVTESLLL